MTVALRLADCLPADFCLVTCWSQPACLACCWLRACVPAGSGWLFLAGLGFLAGCWLAGWLAGWLSGLPAADWSHNPEHSDDLATTRKQPSCKLLWECKINVFCRWKLQNVKEINVSCISGLDNACNINVSKIELKSMNVLCMLQPWRVGWSCKPVSDTLAYLK